MYIDGECLGPVGAPGADGSSGSPGAQGNSGAGANGGFGAGAGASGAQGGGGGGGLGAGGDIFIASGGHIILEGGLISGGSATGGAAGAGAKKGEGFGGGIFTQGSGNAVQLAPLAGQTLTISDPIADQTGSGGAGTLGGASGLDIGGSGTTRLDTANSFAGGITIQSGTLDLAVAGAAGSGPISFANTADPTLEFTTATVPTNPIEGFQTGDFIQIDNFTYSSEIFSNGYLTLSGADGTITLDLPGAIASDFQFSSSSGNAVIGTSQAPCFAAGTRLLTMRGEVPVEALREGDAVILNGGGTAPIKWIGRRHLALARHPKPEMVLPVLIEAGALAEGVPCRDLHVSPDHALYLDNHLIPAKALINGFSIRQVRRRAVTYYHVELEAHAVLHAEAAPCESYLETGNRGAFENGGPATILHPDFAQTLREQQGCAPFAEAGSVVEAVRARILARAGIQTTDDPALVIRYQSDGAAIIESRSAIPGHLTPDPRDRRRLGVKIAALTRADGSMIPFDHPALSQGWHDPEPDGRWTNGCAIIPAALCAGQKISAGIVATLAYPIEQPRPSQVAAG
ncbi:Hint domain-containing protein [Acidiphilium sp. AL]|nr:Hint domain-containing protein [Acidiphilium sp. AL]